MKTIKFIDLFSGIGAFHISIKDLFKDSQCVAAVDNNKHAEITYKHNFFNNSENESIFLNDIESEQVIEKLTNKDISYNLRTSPHMYLWRKQWNWMSSTILFKQNKIVWNI